MDETIHEINIRSGQPVTFGLPKTCPVARLVASIPSVGELLSLGKMEESGAWRVVGRSGGEEGRGGEGRSGRFRVYRSSSNHTDFTDPFTAVEIGCVNING